MNVFNIDFLEQDHEKGSGSDLPVAGSGKFVQIRQHDHEFLVFAPKEIASYHADIVKLFCEKRDIDGTYNQSLKRFDFTDISWTVVGGGKFEIDRDMRCIRLYSNSLAYGRFDSKGVQENIRRSAGWSVYTVIID